MSIADLKIIGLDAQKTHRADEYTDLYDMHLILSDTPHPVWRSCFERAHRLRTNATWRRAHINEKYLVIKCIPEELPECYLQDLKEDVELANLVCRNFLQRPLQLTQYMQHPEDTAEERVLRVQAALHFE